MQSSVHVTVRFSARVVPELPRHFGRGIRDKIAHADTGDAEGNIIITLSFRSLNDARDKMLSFGSAVEVLEPLALRLSIADYATQIAGMYSAVTE